MRENVPFKVMMKIVGMLLLSLKLQTGTDVELF